MEKSPHRSGVFFQDRARQMYTAATMSHRENPSVSKLSLSTWLQLSGFFSIPEHGVVILHMRMISRVVTVVHCVFHMPLFRGVYTDFRNL